MLPGSGSRALPAGYGPFEIFMKDGLSESELAISKLLVRLACSFFLATVEPPRVFAENRCLVLFLEILTF